MVIMKIQKLIEEIASFEHPEESITDEIRSQFIHSTDLLNPYWKKKNRENRIVVTTINGRTKRKFIHSVGFCYVASEAVYHILGGKNLGWQPYYYKYENGDTHWWIKKLDAGYKHLGVIRDTIVDPTYDQVEKDFDYNKGKRGGFLTKEPSKKACILIERVHEKMTNPCPF